MSKKQFFIEETNRLSITPKQPKNTSCNKLSVLSDIQKTVGEENDLYSDSQLSLFAIAPKIENSTPLLSLNDVCERLSISIATGRNWIKTEKLIPLKYEQKKPLFVADVIQKLLDDINSGESNKLKSRRNKKKISGISTYRDYITDSGHNTQIVERLVAYNADNYSEKNLRIILANFAIQLILQKKNVAYEVNNLLCDFLDGGIDLYPFRPIIYDLLKGVRCLKDDIDAVSFALNEKPIFIEGQDFLGFVYISLSNAAQRKMSGAYYTPITVVEKLINAIQNQRTLNCMNIFDPCCGTGNFLIALKKYGVTVSNIFGQDIDEISCQLTRINIVVNYNVKDINILYSHFIVGDTLQTPISDDFDIVLGNPPWGYDFSIENTNYLQKNYQTASERGLESYDLFVEKSLRVLKRNGLLAFVLPEAILTVKTHRAVRQLLIENCSFKFIDFIGNAFSGVQCPSIILGVSADSESSTVGCKVVFNDTHFTINEQRALNADCISLYLTDDEQSCVNKISDKDNRFTLKGHADFALGIVTGDNKSSISQIKEINSEIVLKGSHIKKYNYCNPHNYIQFTPETFQQVAPVEKYRSPEKLFYRFICESLVFAYDNKQTLSLNSCNILIPHVPGIDMKYIMGILNSRVATFWWKKTFNSVKVLRSHIEELPFPIPSEHLYRRIIVKIDQILSLTGEPASDLYESIDKDIMELYGLSDNEQLIVRQALTKTNLFI